METIYVRPVNGDWTRECINLANIIALYKDKVVNVGKPSLAPYYPSLSNMFGYERASEKGIYEIVPSIIAKNCVDPVYVIGVNWENFVMQFIKPANKAAELKPVFDSDLSDYIVVEEENNTDAKQLKRVQ